MGNYATVTQFRQRVDTTNDATIIAQLSRVTLTSEQDIYLEQLITRAEGLVNSFISRRYNTPIVTDASDGLLQEMTLVIAEFELYKRGMASHVPEKYRYSYEKILDLLGKISTGELTPWAGNEDVARNTSIDVETDRAVMTEKGLGVL